MGEILFEADIVKLVASDLDMDEKKIEYHVKFFKDFLNSLTERDDIHTINFPHLGMMYRSLKTAGSVKRYIEWKEWTEKKKDIYQRNKKCVEEILEELKTFDRISLHNKNPRIGNVFFHRDKSWRELEDFQNEK